MNFFFSHFLVIDQEEKNMSRFFQGSDSDTESSSSGEDDIYSDQEDEDQLGEGSDMDEDDEDDEDEESESEDEGGRTRNYFLKAQKKADSDESDEEEVKRVVKSAKDKRFEEIEATTKAIENGGKINDWVVISNGTP